VTETSPEPAPEPEAGEQTHDDTADLDGPGDDGEDSPRWH
jgi:hypothetical protein